MTLHLAPPWPCRRLGGSLDLNHHDTPCSSSPDKAWRMEPWACCVGQMVPREQTQGWRELSSLLHRLPHLYQEEGDSRMGSTGGPGGEGPGPAASRLSKGDPHLPTWSAMIQSRGRDHSTWGHAAVSSECPHCGMAPACLAPSSAGPAKGSPTLPKHISAPSGHSPRPWKPPLQVASSSWLLSCTVGACLPCARVSFMCPPLAQGQPGSCRSLTGS